MIISERYPPKGNRLNISLKGSKKLASDQKILFQNSIFPIFEAGLEVFKRDIGTGYHMPKGIMLALGKSKHRLAKYQKEIIRRNMYNKVRKKWH